MPTPRSRRRRDRARGGWRAAQTILETLPEKDHPLGPGHPAAAVVVLARIEHVGEGAAQWRGAALIALAPLLRFLSELACIDQSR